MNFSEEIIEIGNTEYKLFINRAGIVAWEKIAKYSEFQELLKRKYLNIDKRVEELTQDVDVDVNELADDFDPFSLVGNLDTIDEDENKLRESLKTFYWIALKKHYDFGKTKAFELYDEAEKDYGIEQLTELLMQMITNANENLTGVGELKNLKALKPTK